MYENNRNNEGTLFGNRKYATASFSAEISIQCYCIFYAMYFFISIL